MTEAIDKLLARLDATVDKTVHREIGAVMRDKRSSKGMSLRDVADKVGVSAQFVGDLEKGHRNWSRLRAEAFLEALE